jgi:hypothetical protein
MREQLRRESDVRDAGLTTADLANLDEPRTISRSDDVVRDKGLDKGTAELESRQIDFRDVRDVDARDVNDQTEFDEARMDRVRFDEPVVDQNRIDQTQINQNVAERSARTSGPVPTVPPVAVQSDENSSAPLFSSQEATDFRERWNALQVGFVDEPRQAVQDADGLVAGAMKRLAEIFAEERARLDQQWDRGGDVSTEDLRVALRRYRSFFGRLLSV